MKVTLSDREGFAAFLLRARARNIVNQPLFKAMEAIPRRAFVAPEHGAIAYGERSIPIDCGETIEGIDLQALMIDALDLKARHRVLEIGTGSGYTAAVMARCAARVASVDRFRTLIEQAQSRLTTLQISNVVLRQDNGADVEAFSDAFDRIIVWAAFESLPRAFTDRLASDGVMVCPIGDGEGVQAVARLSKIGSRFERADITSARFQPLAKQVAAAL